MSDATVKLMDITSDMSSALQVGADDGQVMQRNGKRNERMNDLIKREDALKELRLDNKDVIYIDKTECARRIKAIPSADRPQGEWIPCSERLPEAGVSVIVTSKGGYVYTSNIAHGEWEYGGDVVAWMSLPEPWKGADNDN